MGLIGESLGLILLGVFQLKEGIGIHELFVMSRAQVVGPCVLGVKGLDSLSAARDEDVL